MTEPNKAAAAALKDLIEGLDLLRDSMTKEERRDFSIAIQTWTQSPGEALSRKKRWEEIWPGGFNPYSLAKKLLDAVGVGVEGYDSTEPLKFDKWPGDETDKELMDQLREVE